MLPLSRCVLTQMNRLPFHVQKRSCHNNIDDRFLKGATIGFISGGAFGAAYGIYDASTQPGESLRGRIAGSLFAGIFYGIFFLRVAQ